MFKKNLYTYIVFSIFFIVAITSFFVAIFPENKAIRLTDAFGWSVSQNDSSRVGIGNFPAQYSHIRQSVEASSGAQIFRTWTPDRGLVPLNLESAPFKPTSYMSVQITGKTRTPKGLNQVFIECESNAQRLYIFAGDVNVNLGESLISIPDGWCPGNARAKLIATGRDSNVGIGDVFKVSSLSYLKNTFIGMFSYYLVAIGFFGFLMFAGAVGILRLHKNAPIVAAALVSLGIVSIAMFYMISFLWSIKLSLNYGWICIVALSFFALAILMLSGDSLRKKALQELSPYFQIWLFAGIGYLLILTLTYNGLGHWGPNYRFWPAVWSSDNELPWMFAEALRKGWDLKNLFGGGWLPTDRPPLMAGSYLILIDLLNLLQINNDGGYLRGSIYNVVAISINALWAPVAWWMLKILSPKLCCRDRFLVLLLAALVPFIFFNAVYGWPKLYSAVFAMAAFCVFSIDTEQHANGRVGRLAIYFFILSAFSVLTHASSAIFLLPIVMIYCLRSQKSFWKYLLVGFIAAFVVTLSWSLYKSLILPSTDPLLKYALTGDFGFNDQSASLLEMISKRYEGMNFATWIALKKVMALQLFLPQAEPSLAQIGINSEFGIGLVEGLRAWDFLLISKGNSIVALLVLLSLYVWVNRRIDNRARNYEINDLYFQLIGISFGTWILVVFGFFAPVVMHHLPLAAIVCSALAGAAVVRLRYYFLFSILLGGAITYFGAVWIISPLHSALAIDISAALMMIFLVLILVISFVKPNLYPENVDNRNLPDNFSNSLKKVLHVLSMYLNRIKSYVIWRYALIFLFVAAFYFVTDIALRFIDQPLADAHAFRQTQTALSAFWMVQESWRLPYQTPVVGYPWSIPFEFPFYQYLVASITGLTNFSLDSVGRFVSYAFLIFCIFPAFAISRRLHFPRMVPIVFGILLWTSPIYVYWGRTFMIETAATFMIFSCLPFAIDLIKGVGGLRSKFWFIFFGSAAVLQKATTGGPLLMYLAIWITVGQFIVHGWTWKTLRSNLLPFAIICIPLVLGLSWAHYADTVKSANEFGSQLTSNALNVWNFGTLSQRLDLQTWKVVVWQRSFGWNAAGLFGLIVLLTPWFCGGDNRYYLKMSAAALGLFFLPLIIFINLHVVHEYYQVGAIIFLLGALSIVIGGWLPLRTGTLFFTALITVIIVFSNLLYFSKSYGIVVGRKLDELFPQSVQAYKVGSYLREKTNDGTGLVIFGQGYSSELGYHAQRKSMTAPEWMVGYRNVWRNPKEYLGDLDLSAIVVCPNPKGEFPNYPSMAEINARLNSGIDWKHVSIYGCEILLSNQHVKKEK
jgi:hypothetical protein